MASSSERVVSGIRPTGDLHLGNYLGAIRDFIALQGSGKECFFFVADLHALTTAAQGGGRREDVDAQTVEVLRLYLASGLDPDRCTLYRQSDIPQIPYLALLLGMIAPEGELRRCTTYKDQVSRLENDRQLVSLGLLAYPVLMAADVLFCNADLVPVGEDQIQHLEIVREIARRYNTHISSAHRFSEPAPYRMGAVRVPGLKGEGKMSKSVGSPDNAVLLLDSHKEIERKVMSALTDSGPDSGTDGGADGMSGAIRNLFTLVDLCCAEETAAEYRAMYERGEQRFYGAMKKQLSADVRALLLPIQERYNTPECSVERVRQLLFESAEQVRTLAQRTLSAVQADFHLNRADRGTF